jgi:hypothetical protein
MKAIILISLMIIVSCSPLKRFNKFIDKHPEFIQKDTIKVIDTTITIEAYKDTTFITSFDTVVLTEKNLEVKYFYDTITKTKFVSGKCKPDTIISTKEVIVEKVVYKEAEKKVSIWNRIELILALLVLMIIALFGIRILKT